MIEGIKKRNHRKKRSIYNCKWKLFSFFCIFFSIQTFCQDSIPIAKDLAEENDLNFQQNKKEVNVELGSGKYLFRYELN